MNPRERLILILDGLDVQIIFVSTGYFFLCKQLGYRHVFYTDFTLRGESSAPHILTLICVEGPFGFLKNFQSVVDQCFYRVLYTWIFRTMKRGKTREIQNESPDLSWKYQIAVRVSKCVLSIWVFIVSCVVTRVSLWATLWEALL